MVLTSSSTEVKTSRRSCRSINWGNHPSTRLSHDALVGVQCRCHRSRFGCASHRVIGSALCGARLSRTTWTARCAGTCRSIRLKKASTSVRWGYDDARALCWSSMCCLSVRGRGSTTGITVLLPPQLLQIYQRWTTSHGLLGTAMGRSSSIGKCLSMSIEIPGHCCSGPRRPTHRVRRTESDTPSSEYWGSS